MRLLCFLAILLLGTAPLPAALFTSAVASGYFANNSAFGSSNSQTGTSGASAGANGVAASYLLAPASFQSSAVATASYGSLTGYVFSSIVSGTFGDPGLGGAPAASSGQTSAQFTDLVRFVPVPGIANGSLAVLRLNFTMSGTGSATNFPVTITAPGGLLSVGASAALNSSIRDNCSTGADFRDGGSRTCTVVLVSNSGANVFRSGVNIDAFFQVSGGVMGGATTLLPFLQASVVADGSHTATFSGIEFFIDGNQLLPSQFSVLADSGAVYPYAAPNNGSVPEPGSLLLTALGAALLWLARGRACAQTARRCAIAPALRQ